MKKVLSLVLALVLVLGMIPTFAADATGAQALYDNGFITGKDGTDLDSKLDVNAPLTRAQYAALIAELNGEKAEAAAFAQPANFTDFSAVAGWAKNYVAYAQINGWMKGYTDGTFRPNGAVSAAELVAVLMNVLGYPITDFNTVLAEAAELGIVAEGTALTRGEAFNAMWTAVAEVKMYNSDMTLGQHLGKLDPPVVVPTTLVVESVTSSNLIQAVVTFNQPVDAETAEDKDNYDFATADKITIDNATLSEDGTEVTLMFAAKVAQQKTASLTVSGVKTAAGMTVTKSTTPVSFLDSTIPTIVSTEVVGVSTIKVTFSEPMDPTTVVAGSFKVNDGKYYVKSPVVAQKSDTEFLVELFTSLKTGDLPFEVKVGPTDYAGFTAMGKTATLTVVEDTEKPFVVSYKEAKPNSVVLVWNEDIVLVSGVVGNFYHTNATNTIDNALTSLDIDGNEMTLNFDNAHKLPNGTAYAYVLKDAVKDLWNNKNVQQMTQLDVVVDKDGPVLSSLVYKAENQIQLVFDEAIDPVEVKKANFTLLDKDGKEVTNIISSFGTGTVKKIMVNFTKKLEGGDYTIVVKNLEDLSGNAMSSTSLAFTVTDKTAPIAADDFSAVLYDMTFTDTTDQILKISFGQAMAVEGAYSIADLSKYILTDGGALEDVDDVTIEVVDDGKAVEITIPHGELPVTLPNQVEVARVADAAGNYTALLQQTIEIDPAGNVEIDKVALTGAKEVKVYFSDSLSVFEADEIIIATGALAANQVKVASVNTELVSGKTVATFTMADTYIDNTTAFNGFDYAATNLVVRTVAGPLDTANIYGEDLTAVAVNVATRQDKLAPILEEITVLTEEVDNVVIDHVSKRIVSGDAVYRSLVTLDFTENLDLAYISNNSFDVAGYDVVSIALDGGDASVVLVTVEGDNYVDVDNTITLESPIRDAIAGNATSTLETSVSVVNADAAFTAAVTSGNATGLVLTFTKELYNNNVAIADGADVKALFNYSGTAGNYTSATYNLAAKTVTFVFTAAEDAKTITVAGTVSDTTGNALSTTTDVVTFTAVGAVWAIN